MKNVNANAARFFVCSKCDKTRNCEVEVQQEVMCDEVETVKGFRYYGDRLNVSAGCEATMSGMEEIRECGKILFGKRFSLQMKGKVYRIYLSIMHKIFYQKKNSKSGCVLNMGAGLAKEMVFHNKMHHFLGYALAPELRKS